MLVAEIFAQVLRISPRRKRKYRLLLLLLLGIVLFK